MYNSAASHGENVYCNQLARKVPSDVWLDVVACGLCMIITRIKLYDDPAYLSLGRICSENKWVFCKYMKSVQHSFVLFFCLLIYLYNDIKLGLAQTSRSSSEVLLKFTTLGRF